MATAITYPPLNTLKPVCPDVWIVDGPVIRSATRMSLLRLGSDLLVHSPTPLFGTLQQQIAGIGRVRWIVGPNRQHYSWIPDWHAAYPEAEIHLAAGIVQQARGRIDFPHQQLPRGGGYPWDETIDTLAVSSSSITEMEFFHRPSRTLVLTDLVENLHATPPASRLARLLSRASAARHPGGAMPAAMRQKFSAHLPQLREAVERLIALDPARVIIAHGRWFDANGAAELRRAFAWLLPR